MSTAAKTPNYNLSQVVGSDIPDWITDYTSDMGKIDAALKENADDVDVVRPDEFSEESTYVAGDYCIKNNVIYKAKTAVAAGAFDVSDWEATSIFKELSALTNNLNGTISISTSSFSQDAKNATITHDGIAINNSDSGYYFVIARAMSPASDWCCAIVRITGNPTNYNIDIVGNETGIIKFSETTGNLLYRSTAGTFTNVRVMTIKM